MRRSLDLDLVATEGQGGYARELTAEEQRASSEALAERSRSPTS